MWPGADEIHVSAPQVGDLRKLAQPESPQPASDPRDAGDVVPLPQRGLLGAGPQRAELEEREALAARTDTRLNDQYRPLGIELDGQRDQSEKRGQADERDGAGEQAGPAGQGQVQARLPEALAEDELAGIQGFERELPAQALVDLSAVLHDDSPTEGLQQIGDRQGLAAFGQRNDDALGTDLLDDLAQVRERAQHGVAGRRRLPGGG